MSYMNNDDSAPAGGIQELNFNEVDSVSGGPLPLIVVAAAAAAGTAIVGTAAVGFVDGLIEGFQDDE